MKLIDPVVARVLAISIPALAFIVIAAWATLADPASRLAYWVRRIQAGMTVVTLAALFIWAAWSLIAGAMQ